MVYEMIHDVRINGQRYKIIECSINKTIDNFTNSATIILPKRLRLNNEDIFSDISSFILKVDDVVSIKLGYKQGSQTLMDTPQFEGFISQINIQENNVQIICEDYMYYLKRSKFNFSKVSMSLKDLGNKIVEEVNNILPKKLPKITVNANDIDLTLSNVKFEKINGVEILDHLKSNYTLDSFFIGNVLNIGVNYGKIASRSQSSIHTFSTFPAKLIKTVTNKKLLHIIDKSNLKYQKKEDVKLKINVKIFKTNSEYELVSRGDADGEERTFIMSGNPSASEIDNFISNQLERYKYEGFAYGSKFTTFGKPNINLLDIVSFDGIGFIRYYDNNTLNTSKVNVYKKASYLVNSVETTFNTGGFRQIIGISHKISIDEDNDSVATKLSKTKNI